MATAMAMATSIGDGDRDEAAEEAKARQVAGTIGPMPVLADADADTADNQPIVSLDDQNRPTFVGDAHDDTDGSDDPDFADAMMAPAMISGWTGATYTRTTPDDPATAMADETVVDTVVKYNDKQPPGPQNYNTFFGTAQPGATGAHASGVLTLTAAVTDDTRGFIGADFGITAPHQTIPYAARTDDPMTTSVDESTLGHDISGTFYGVSGTFSCAAGSACPVVSNDMGMLSSLTGWTFRPSASLDMEGEPLTGTPLTNALNALMVQGVIPDADFMIFGYWMQVSQGEMGEVNAFLPIADGTMPYGGDTGTVASVAGSATYVGPATGLYMSKSLTPQGQPTQPFNSGQFTATATLNAVFGQTTGSTLAPNTLFSISGTIDNFMTADGEMINSLWVVSLEPTTLGAAGTVEGSGTGDSNTFSGVTKGMNLSGSDGAYSGTFYGPAGTDNAQPSSAAGMFDAHFSNGHVRGAFATHRTGVIVEAREGL